MTALSIQPPFPTITDTDGQPLENGYIWIGTANLPAQTTPISVYWDAALTQPAAQPIRTQGGYPVNSGTPARLYVNSDYSILVQNSRGTTVYSAPQATERYGGLIISSADVSFLQAGLGAVTRTAQSKMRDVVSVLDFIPPNEHAAIFAGTSVYDAGPAFNAALATSKNVCAPSGTYRINTAIQATVGLNTFTPGPVVVGEGVGKTILEGQFATAAVLRLTSAGPNKFIYGARIEGLTLRPYAVESGSRGIDLRSVYVCEIRNCEITGFGGDGIRIISQVGDGGSGGGGSGAGGDPSAHIIIENCNIRANGAHGINTVFGANVIHAVLVEVKNNFIWFNGAGGIHTGAQLWTISNNSIYGNRGFGGIFVFDSGATAEKIDIIQNEFDSNSGAHITFERIFDSLIDSNQFKFVDDLTGYGYRPLVAVRLSQTGKTCQDVTLLRNMVSSTPTNPPVPVVLWELGAGVVGFRVEDTFFRSYSGANAQIYAGLAAVQEERRDGQWRGVSSTIYTETSNDYIPDLRNGSVHVLTVTQQSGVGLHYINSPINPANGAELELHVVNGSGGTISTAWGSAYRYAGYIEPANGKRVTVRFRYRSSTTKWEQIGAWSPDLT